MIEMRYWLIAAGIFTYFWFVHCDGIEGLPEQVACPGVKALPFVPPAQPTAMTLKLWVGRVLVSDVMTTNVEGPSNSCSPITYGEGCEGSLIIINIEKDGSRVVNTISYNKDLGKAVCYIQAFSQDDEHYQIFHGTVTKLNEVDAEGTLVNYESIPQAIIDHQAKSVATVYVCPDRQCAIYLACDGKSGWVAYTDAAVQQQKIDEFKDAIDEELKSRGFDPVLFVKIPTEIPVNVDQCTNINV